MWRAFESVGISACVATFFTLTTFFITDCQNKEIESNNKVNIIKWQVEKVREENKILFKNDINNFKIVPREDYLK